MSDSKLKYITKFCLVTSCFLPWNVRSAMGQVIPDQSLPNNSVISVENDKLVINGGSIRGDNLFHSFSQFSVPTNATALFNSALTIENIISRVTGTLPSNVDGIIQANGGANLYIINPNGITFGPNARLQIGGSFMASTANHMVFADGYQYNTGDSTDANLLTNTIPVGLGFLNPGEITVQGTGSNLLDSPFAPFTRLGTSFGGLNIQSGRSLALVGGDITFNGGLVSSPSGSIELGAINDGTVRFEDTAGIWSFDYSDANELRDIQLSDRSLVDGSGMGSSAITLQGGDISLSDGSVILIQNIGSESDRNVQINASNSLHIEGIAFFDQLFNGLVSGIYSETLGSAPGADLLIVAPQVTLDKGNIGSTSYGEGSGGSISITSENLSVLNGAFLGSATASSGIGGDITINSSNTIVSGFNSLFAENSSAIVSNARGLGAGGDTTITGGSLSVNNRGSLGTNTLGLGQGGDVYLNLSEQVQITGELGSNFNDGTLTPSNLTSSTFSTGQAGSLFLDTPKLLLNDSGIITASTFYQGDAGEIVIQASELVQLQRGFISSGAIKPPNSIREFLQIPDELSGAAGGITLDSPIVQISDGGAISVENNGSGREGNIDISSELIQMNNGAITTSASADANGGNIFIDSELFSLVNNSSIIANSQTGTGGQVLITTTGIFQDTTSTITATSAAGPQFDGTVTIQAPESNPNAAASDSPSFQPPQTQSVCGTQSASGQNEFVVAGRGGLPSPDSLLGSNSGWQELVLEDTSFTETMQPSSPIVEAQGFVFNADGTVSLTAFSAQYSQLNTSLQSQSCSIGNREF